MDCPILISVLIIVCTLAATEARGTEKCEPPGWQAKPLTARATEASDIIYGGVTGIYQGMSPEEYLVEMDIKCVLKGGARTERVNITEIGTDCVDNGMRNGNTYIVFVNMLRDGAGRDRYVTNDLNVEKAAHRATAESFKAVRAASGLKSPCNQVQYAPATETFGGTNTGGNRGGNRPGQGNQCTTGDCNAGNVVIAGSLWMLSALVSTVATWNVMA